ncbi:hypothetical protein A3Q56_00849 [Intoshia linei]|uniref:Yippee domain-containing protein n=1 Tax=Intoshia linei TaxID=1819745 RepID=A0A177BAV3_9BILA|nr:hypothetical protein A3Q56_00849 [Intoshia linei]
MNIQIRNFTVFYSLGVKELFNNSSFRYKPNKQYVADSKVFYTCLRCNSHLLNRNDIISKAFHGSSGDAYLAIKVLNITLGKSEERLFMTGVHRQRSPAQCEKYKEGKYILESVHLMKINKWE